jgi:hypothetical protein
MPKKVVHELVDVPRVAHDVLGVDHLNRTNFHAAVVFEDRAVFGNLNGLIESLRSDQEVSADDFLAFGERPVRNDFSRRADDFAAGLQRIAREILALVAQPLDPVHPLLHLRLHSFRRRWSFSPAKQKHEITHNRPLL